MKQYRVRIKLKTSSFSIETIINANATSDVKKLLEAQYGSNLQSLGIPQELSNL